MVAEIALFTVGLLFVTFGADWLVRGASNIASHLGVSPLVVGLTIVAFGTSAPELVVSGAAALRDQPGLAVGNVMGSTVANVGLIVGLGALLRPITVHRRLLVRESPLLILVLGSVMLLSLNHALGRLDGLALIVGFILYLRFLIRWSRSGGEGEGRPETPEGEEGATSAAGGGGDGIRWPDVARVIVGIPALLVGANWMLDSAIDVARAFDVPEAVIGATMVALGTSLPELASTIAAAVRELGDIAIGNVIGSNVFNLGLVLGSAALLRPLELPPETVVRQVLPALIFCIVLIPLAYTGRRVNRWEGSLLLVGYGGFIAWVL